MLQPALAPLVADPEGTALLFDFDGTLSPTVVDAAAARPAEGAVELLAALAERYRTVGIVSGRPVSFLVEHLPSTLVLSGQYGLEIVDRGTATVLPEVDRWREVIDDAVARSEAASIPGMVIEPKGLTLTLHYRQHPELAAQVEALAASIAAATNLHTAAAKMSVELRPPIDTDKGAVVRGLAGGARNVLYAGDDIGDLPALRAVRALRDDGIHTVTLVVDSPELPEAVRTAGDVVVDGTAGMLDVLRHLASPR